jgi:hypothetical protein
MKAEKAALFSLSAAQNGLSEDLKPAQICALSMSDMTFPSPPGQSDAYWTDIQGV